MSVACLALGLLCAIWTCVVLTSGADITEVSTREGDDAILPCALGSKVDLTDEAFDWKKGKQEVFFYIQGKDYNIGWEGQDPHYVGRVHLLPGGLQAGNASVVLSGVTQADSGVYECVILTRQTNRRIRLTVAGAGIPDVVTNLGDTDTEVFRREGEDAILPCGLGSPVNLKDEVFDWKKKQQEVFFYEKGKHYNNGKRGQDPQFVGRVHLLPGGLQAGNASVNLTSVTQADGGVYSCYFPRRKLTRCIRLTVAVEPRLRLEVVEAPPSSGSVRLSCVSRGGQPQPSGLEWQTPNGTVIPAEEAPPAASSDGDGRYSISQTVEVTEPGSYTCVARQQGVHPAVRDTIRVFVNWQSLTGDRGEVFWNGTRNALCVLTILSIMLSFGAKMYKCCAKKKNSKEGIVQNTTNKGPPREFPVLLMTPPDSALAGAPNLLIEIRAGPRVTPEEVISLESISG
ncbi:uncharacterized protein LOC132447796 isoform X2 [Gadus macrocephalus]|uniref:uncharacterized protein LOC132447796 isoform X2 n=1 Tax=Gadus macrocephalus TaxID=80720 RepID=UPI0028CB4E3A|nr:uncharacterized protein LOC132447796 isoform X2 [Gadus macrocephalus]